LTDKQDIDSKLDELFERISGLGMRTAIRPDPAGSTYFTAPIRASLGPEGLEAIERNGVVEEMRLLLGDVPGEVRDDLLGRLAELLALFPANGEDRGPEPPSLVYALH
jgi:hypothetical protein